MWTCLKIHISIPCTMQGSDDMRLRKNFAKTNYFKFSYFNGVVDSWNSLPSSIHNSSNLKTFRCNLMKYLNQS